MAYHFYKFIFVLWGLLFLVVLIFLWGLPFLRNMPCVAPVPTVVVTIKPIHSLVAGVMEGVGNPFLLMKGDRSPHTQSLTPDMIRQIRDAHLVVWVGSTYEAPLHHVITTLKGDEKVMTLMDAPGLHLYPARQGGLWGGGCHDHGDPANDQEDCNEEEPEHHQVHDPLSTDGHIWLDPSNAQAIVKVIAEKLASLDPQHKADYLANCQKVISRLDVLDQEIEKLMAPVRHKPYMVYHDGTQYFDRHFQTKAVGALMGASHRVNARHFLEVRNYIRTHKVYCIFTEPQFPTAQIQPLLDKTDTKIGTLDYLGVDLAADANAYFLMMHRLTNGFLKGLSG